MTQGKSKKQVKNNELTMGLIVVSWLLVLAMFAISLTGCETAGNECSGSERWCQYDPYNVWECDNGYWNKVERIREFDAPCLEGVYREELTPGTECVPDGFTHWGEGICMYFMCNDYTFIINGVEVFEGACDPNPITDEPPRD